MRLLYLAAIRLPTEKAHGLQIMQMCEAFAQSGAQVSLITARRVNTESMQHISDPWDYYGVMRNFQIERAWCLDLFPLGKAFERFAFPLMILSYTLSVLLWMLIRPAEVYYSRDVLTLLALSLVKPRRRLCYEAHNVATSRIGGALQRLCLRRVGTVIAVTGKLREALVARGATNVHVEHDGFQISRFADLPSPESARAALGLPAVSDGLIVGYTGRLHTLSLSKGIDTLIAAIAAIPTQPDYPIWLCLVGGPAEMAEELRQHWQSLGLPPDRFLFAGHQPPTTVPRYLAAFDVCAMPSPASDFFKFYASPLKLFEYMASGRAILSTDLPAVAEVLRHEENALLVAPGDVPALSEALRRLYADPTLRQRLGDSARADAAFYAWQSRAARILALLPR